MVSGKVLQDANLGKFDVRRIGVEDEELRVILGKCVRRLSHEQRRVAKRNERDLRIGVAAERKERALDAGQRLRVPVSRTPLRQRA